MADEGDSAKPRFETGQVIRHRVWGYRGVIAEVHATFQGDDQWYRVQSARANQTPPRDEPWYAVLVHDSNAQTYVAEQNLEPDPSGEPVRHPYVIEPSADSRDGGMLN